MCFLKNFPLTWLFADLILRPRQSRVCQTQTFKCSHAALLGNVQEISGLQYLWQWFILNINFMYYFSSSQNWKQKKKKRAKNMWHEEIMNLMTLLFLFTLFSGKQEKMYYLKCYSENRYTLSVANFQFSTWPCASILHHKNQHTQECVYTCQLKEAGAEFWRWFFFFFTVY